MTMSNVYQELEEIKRFSWDIYRDTNNSVKDRANAATNILETWWERDVNKGRYNSRDVPFRDFVAMWNLENEFNDADVVKMVRHWFGQIKVPRKLKKVVHRFGWPQ